jgi:hypothetical protein
VNSYSKSLLALAGCVVATACGSVPTQRFTFDAIDVEEQPQPALVVVEDDWVKAWDENHVVNVAGDDMLTIDLPFPTAKVQVMLVPLKVANGKATSKPLSRTDAVESSGMTVEIRELFLRDPQRQLFILQAARK